MVKCKYLKNKTLGIADHDSATLVITDLKCCNP